MAIWSARRVLDPIRMALKRDMAELSQTRDFSEFR